jgi:hypothetical protein
MQSSEDQKAAGIRDASRAAIADVVWKQHRQYFMDKVDGIGVDGMFKSVEDAMSKIRKHISKYIAVNACHVPQHVHPTCPETGVLPAGGSTTTTRTGRTNDLL